MTAVEQRKTLPQFIRDYLKTSEMSARKLAERAGVSSRTINKIIDESKPYDEEPSMRLLLKLAKATNTNVFTLITMAYPEAAAEAEAYIGRGVNYALLAEQIENLPPAVRDIIDRLILQYVQQNQH